MSKTIIVGVPYDTLVMVVEDYADLEGLLRPDETLTDVGAAVGEYVSEDGKTVYFEATVVANETQTIVELDRSEGETFNAA